MTTTPAILINVFETDPTRQPELVAVLSEAIDAVVSRRPGFIEARVLAAADGSRVVNEVTWESADAIAATRSDPAMAEFAARAAALGTASPAVYTLQLHHGA